MSQQMKTFSLCLVALAAAVTLTSVAAAGHEAAKQRVAINIKNPDNGTFVLTPLQAGTFNRDSGTVSLAYNDPTIVMREGQRISIYRNTYTLRGKRGSLRFESGPSSSASRTRRSQASTSPRASAPAPGRSWAGRGRTPRSPEADGAACRANPGSYARRVSSLVHRASVKEGRRTLRVALPFRYRTGLNHRNGAAQESNLPSVGLRRRTGFEDQLGHRPLPLRCGQ